MKKARQVVVPEDRPLTQEEYQDLSEHAYNSSLWYAGEYLRTSQQVRDKLYRKGYPRGSVEVQQSPGGPLLAVNMVEDVIVQLESKEVISDRLYAEHVIKTKVAGGVSLMRAKQEVQAKGISRELADEVGEDLEEEAAEEKGFERAFSLAMKAPAVRQAKDPWARKKKIMTILARKGYSLDMIYKALDSWDEEAEDDRWMI